MLRPGDDLARGSSPTPARLAKEGIAKLDRYAAAGVPILGLEPSCILTLADEWPELVPGPAAKRVAAAAEMAEAWLARQVRDNGLSLDVPATAGEGAVPRALPPEGARRARRAARRRCGWCPALDVTVLDAGCCGMAGAFGYEKEHYDVSVQIANLALVPAVNADPAATVVATGTSCRHQIRDLTGREALHPLEVLAGVTPESHP